MPQHSNGEVGVVSFQSFKKTCLWSMQIYFFEDWPMKTWVCDAAGFGGFLKFDSEDLPEHNFAETIPKPGDFVDPNEAPLIVMLPGLGFHVVFSLAFRVLWFPTCQVRVVRFYVSLLLLFLSSPLLLLRIHSEQPRPVFPTRPQPRSFEPSVPCRTSTATIGGQCSLPGLNRDHLRPVFLPDFRKNVRKNSECQTERRPENMSERVSEDMSARMSENMSERMSEDMPERMSQDMLEKMSEHMPERRSERMSENMSERRSENMPERMSERRSDRMLERMSQDMSEKNVRRYARKKVRKNVRKSVRKNVRTYVRKNVRTYVRKNVRKYVRGRSENMPERMSE